MSDKGYSLLDRKDFSQGTDQQDLIITFHTLMTDNNQGYTAIHALVILMLIMRMMERKS